MPDAAAPPAETGPATTEGRPGAPGAAAEAASQVAAQRAFSTSMLVSAVRCLLTYVLLPFVAPAVGFAAKVGPGLGILIGTVAIASNVLTIRRFHATRHRWRRAYTAVAVAVIGLLLVAMGHDLTSLA